jgi:hypothetical protein
MTRAKAKTEKKTSKRGPTAGGRARKPVDLEAVRQKISNRVGSEALGMVETTIAEADKGHFPAMKYLFELIGLYPATEQEVGHAGEDSLARTLLKRLGLPEDPATERAAATNVPAEAVVASEDAVK